MTDLHTTLVEQAQRGAPQARRQIYDRYCRLVLAICMDTTGSLADAEDLAQEVFVRVFQGLYDLRDPSRFPGWLTAIARRLCVDWTRKRTRDRRLYAVDSNEVLAHAADDSQGVDTSHLRDAMAQLHEDQRLALHLFYLDQESAESARQFMGLSKSSFYRLLEQARQSLRRLLQIDQEILS
jgi:RNA polymerase sigma-70 factor, ECF subfamily